MTRTWPTDWDNRVRGQGCTLCDQGRPEENDFGIRIYTSETADGYLQKADVGQRGYCFVVWRGRHVAEPTELAAGEASAYWSDVLQVMRALQTHYTPAKTNLFILGNELPHLHTHVVPRYLDDREPGRPPRFMRIDEPHPPLPADEVRQDALSLRKLLQGRLGE